MGEDARRMRALEREWTIGAATSVGLRADRLIEFAEERAGDGPVRDYDARDFGREALEELADARNYLVWLTTHGIRDHTHRDLDTANEIMVDAAGAIAAVVTAFEHTHRARVLAGKLKDA